MTCQPFRELIITDGTSTDEGVPNAVDLLNCASGFCLTDWMPSIAMKKGGGVWANSALADGRRLRFFRRANAIETYTLQLRSPTQDALIRETQKLRRLLEKAVVYWTTSWQNEPVWVQAVGANETERRYSIIMDWQTPNDGNPYEEPFVQGVIGSGMADWMLTIEREPTWRADEPGEGTAIAISNAETYDFKTYGVTPASTSEIVYIANKRNEANLTDSFTWSAANGWSANLQNVGLLPFDVIDIAAAAPQVNDFIEFGIDTTLGDSGPFCSLVFDLATAQTGIQLTWEYWNGAWVALTVQDNTDAAGLGTGQPFDTAGVNSVHWQQPGDWATRAENGITGYWVRCRVTAVPGPVVAPVQQNRLIYSIVWPYIEVAETEVGGDIPALVAQYVRTVSGGNPIASLRQTRIMVGVRSYDRGSNFTAFLNFADEQNPAGVTVPTGAMTNRIQSPCGRCAHWVPALAVSTLRFEISIDETIVTDFYGRYRAFARCYQDGGTTGDLEITLNLRSGNGMPLEEIATAIPTVNIDYELLDFGIVNLGPPDSLGNIAIDDYDLEFWIVSAAGATDFFMYDVVLLPVDEWSGEFVLVDYVTAVSAMNYTRRLEIDSLYFPKRDIRAPVRDVTTANLVLAASYIPITPSPAIVQANAKQRVWFFSGHYRPGDPPNTSYQAFAAHTVQTFGTQRYLSMRGDR